MIEGAYLFIIFALVVAALWYSNRGILRPLAAVLDEEQAEVEGIVTPYVKGHFHGREVRLALDQRQGKQTLRMEFFTGKPWQLQIERRTIWTRLEKRLRPSSYTTTRENEFNARFAVFSFPAIVFASWLARPEIRAAVEELFDRHDIRRIEHENQNLKASFEFNWSRESSPNKVRPILEQMTQLLHSLDSIS
ncbi:MAG: hypothetical protein ABSG54_08540 [Terriglobia bacterium]|jgi:hypothetical protein